MAIYQIAGAVGAFIIAGGCVAANVMSGGGPFNGGQLNLPLIGTAVFAGIGLLISYNSYRLAREGVTTSELDEKLKESDSKRRADATEAHKRDIKADEQRRSISGKIDNSTAQILAELKRQRIGAIDLPEALLNALADRTNADLSLEDQVSDLIARFDAAQDLIAAGERPSNLDAFVRAVQKRVADKTRAGDLDGADKEAGDAFDQWQREEADRAEAAKQGGLAILDTGIDTALARGDAAAAAQREWQKIQLEHAEADWTGALYGRQNHYGEEGERTGARLDLQVSLALCEIGLNTAPTVEDGAGHHNHKAIALEVMGERAGGEDGLTYLRQAIDAYDKALTVRTFETMPADWAMTQQNKAIALRIMGQRAGGEDGLTYLRQAIDAYDKALTVRTFETMPADWAMTQQNKANALRVMGERTGGEDGLTYLRQAIEAYENALTVRTFETMPADWAATQQNKAGALRIMGARAGGEGGLTYLRQAIDAYDEALTVRTRDTVPADWAMTQQNKAGALIDMGARAGGEDGLTYLRQAIDAYDKALTVRTRETMPAYWAMTRANMAMLFLVLLSETNDDSYLSKADIASSDAMSIFQSGGMDWYAEDFQKTVDRITALKAQHQP